MATETVIQRESPEIEALKLGMLKQGKILADKPPEGIEDPTPDLTLAAQDARSLTARTMADNASGDYAPYLQDANTTLNAGIGTLNVGGEAADTLRLGRSALGPGNVQAFMDPYQTLVTDAALADLQDQYDYQQGSRDQAAIEAGAFGGSRAALEEGRAKEGLYRQMANRAFEDYSTNFGNAQKAQSAYATDLYNIGTGLGSLGTSYSDAYGSLAGQKAGLGELGQTLSMNDINVMEQLGTTDQQYDQQQLDITRQNTMADIYEPYNRLGFYADLLSGAPTSAMTLSQSTQQQPSTLSQVAGAAATGIGAYGAAKTSGII